MATRFLQALRGMSTQGGQNNALSKCACVVATLCCVVLIYRVSNPAAARQLSSPKELNIATWNIAAINNNPFEYWITYDDNPVYQQLMVDLEGVVRSPGGEQDVQVEKVFTQPMFDQLIASMKNIGWENLDQVERMWHDDFKQRQIVEGFLREPKLGKKRLASMPDRFTNTIALSGGELAYRPTVINCYRGDLSSQEQWFDNWQKFFFEDTLQLAGEEKSSFVHEMLSPIRHSKYPAITPEEELISLPLQLVCQGIFDAILVHLMNQLASTSWQPMKQEMCQNLNLQKVPRTIKILERSYVHNDAILLQEVSSDFITKLTSSPMALSHHIVLPAKLDTKRDQNSIILLNKIKFGPNIKETTVEITEKVDKALKDSLAAGTKSPLANGDLLAIETTDAFGNAWTLASFHGDTNGLASVPVLTALHKAVPASSPSRLVFGLDANTYEHPGSKGEKQGVDEFALDFVGKGMSSCWGNHPDKMNYTTCNARTFLQPQLNKACPHPQADADGIIRKFHKNADVNLKDYVLFYANHLKSSSTLKDNTGDRQYREGMFFPTMSFPSDHGVLETKLTILDSSSL